MANIKILSANSKHESPLPHLYQSVACQKYKSKALCSEFAVHMMARKFTRTHARTHTHTHPFNGPFFPGLPMSAHTRKIQPIWILLKQETLSGSGISWAICKSAPRSRQITTPIPHHSVFYRSDALPAAKPTVSKH